MIALRKYIGTAIYVYVRIQLYMIIVAELCFIYIGLYMELEQENICSYVNVQQVVAT